VRGPEFSSQYHKKMWFAELGIELRASQPARQILSSKLYIQPLTKNIHNAAVHQWLNPVILAT
jgi:hypothetical protein